MVQSKKESWYVMLNIIIDSITNKIDGEITNPSGYFDAVYEISWFDSQLAKDIIRGIDDTEYVKDHYLLSPVLGGITPRDLSTGCKATLLMLNEDVIIRGERFGDNCAKWILKVADIKDVTITLNHLIRFPEPFKIKLINSGIIVNSYLDLIEEVARIGWDEELLII